MFTLDRIVPWGRSFDEYRAMFALTAGDLKGRILDCAAGPASFAAEAAANGSFVTACDPLYGCSADQIRRRIAETCDEVLEQAERNRRQFVWTTIRSIDELRRLRMQAMDVFLADFGSPRRAGTYVAGELPTLPLRDGAFDLAISSHFLFLYSTQLGETFHVEALRELCRVAREVRVFPLVALDGTESAVLEPATAALQKSGRRVTIERVNYEFQRGGNWMMRIN